MNIDTIPKQLKPWIGSKRARLLNTDEYDELITGKVFKGDIDMSDATLTNAYEIDLIKHPHKKPVLDYADFQSRILWIGTMPDETQEPISFELGKIWKLSNPGSDPTTYKSNGETFNQHNDMTVIHLAMTYAQLAKAESGQGAYGGLMQIIIETNHANNKPAVLNWKYPTEDGAWNTIITEIPNTSVYAFHCQTNFSAFELKPYCGYKKYGENVVFGSMFPVFDANPDNIFKFAVRGEPLSVTVVYRENRWTRWDLYDNLQWTNDDDPDDSSNKLMTYTVHHEYRVSYLDSDYFNWTGWKAHNKIDYQEKYWQKGTNKETAATLNNARLQNYTTWKVGREFELPWQNFSRIQVGKPTTGNTNWIITFTGQRPASITEPLDTIICHITCKTGGTTIIYRGFYVGSNTAISLPKADVSSITLNTTDTVVGNMKYQGSITENFDVHIKFLDNGTESGQVNCHKLKFSIHWESNIYYIGTSAFNVVCCATLSALEITDGTTESTWKDSYDI